VDNAADLSGSWRSMYDGTYLYILAEMNDEAIVNDSGAVPWNDDIVEFFVDPDLSRGSDYDGVNDYQLGIRIGDQTLHTGANSQSDTTGILWGVTTAAGGYVAEIAIPWATGS
jgi:hypothetical protein